MNIIESSFVSNDMPGTAKVTAKAQLSASGSFDTLLAMFETKSTSRTREDRTEGLFGPSYVSDFVDLLIENIHASVKSRMDVFQAPALTPQFPFSASFEETFGLTGPLPNYITMMTSKLGLTAAQNQAYQDISVQFKDTNGSVEDIQAIGKLLSDAGIQG